MGAFGRIMFRGRFLANVTGKQLAIGTEMTYFATDVAFLIPHVRWHRRGKSSNWWWRRQGDEVDKIWWS
jgi:hypothetical protein